MSTTRVMVTSPIFQRHPWPRGGCWPQINPARPGAAIGMGARAARLTFLGALEVAGFGSVILEAGELADVGQLGGVGGAVALLGDDHLGYAWLLAVAMVHLVAIDERDEVGVLLDRARLAQIGEQRAAIGAGLDLAVEL